MRPGLHKLAFLFFFLQVSCSSPTLFTPHDQEIDLFHLKSLTLSQDLYREALKQDEEVRDLALKIGHPDAFELIEKDRGQERVVLLYKAREERYSIQKVSSEGEIDWILSGPYQMEYHEYIYLDKHLGK